MATIIDALVVTLGLDSRQYAKGAADAQDASRKTRQQLGSDAKESEMRAKRVAAAYGQIGSEIKGLALTVAGATGIAELFKSIVSNSAEVGRMATNFGVATTELSAWQQAIKEVSGTAEDANASFQALVSARENLRLRGTTGHDADFAGLGVGNPGDFNDPSALLMKISRRSQSMTPAEFSARAGALGLPQSMINLLQQGPDALGATIGKYRAKGVTDDDALVSQEAVKQLAELGNEIKSQLRPIISDVVQSLTHLKDWIDLHLPKAANSGVATVDNWLHDKIVSLGNKLFDRDPAHPSLGGGALNALLGTPTSANRTASSRGAGEIADRIIAAEGTGKNPLSSAQGVGQFTNASWIGAYKQHFSARGMTDAQILAQRSNPQIATAMTRLVVADYAKTLLAAGLPVTAGSVYLMHFLGQRRALQTLRANPNAAMRSIAPEDIAANPFLSNLTAGDLLKRSQDVMTGARRSLGGRGGGSVSTSSSETSVGVINVYTPATDGDGIARSLPRAIKQHGLVTQANSGLSG